MYSYLTGYSEFLLIYVPTVKLANYFITSHLEFPYIVHFLKDSLLLYCDNIMCHWRFVSKPQCYQFPLFFTRLPPTMWRTCLPSSLFPKKFGPGVTSSSPWHANWANPAPQTLFLSTFISISVCNLPTKVTNVTVNAWNNIWSHNMKISQTNIGLSIF